MIHRIKQRAKQKEISRLMFCRHLKDDKKEGYWCEERGTAYCQLPASDQFFVEQYDCKDCEYDVELVADMEIHIWNFIMGVIVGYVIWGWK